MFPFLLIDAYGETYANDFEMLWCNLDFRKIKIEVDSWDLFDEVLYLFHATRS